MSRQLVMYTIYSRPLDYPNEFVVRRWDGLTCTPIDRGAPFARGRTLDEVREAVPPGLYRLGRLQGDPCILEVWV